MERLADRVKKLKSGRSEYSSAKDLLEAVNSDASLRGEIDYLSRKILRREVSGCSNCFFDAYLELINLTQEKIDMAEVHFRLAAGVLLLSDKNEEICSNFNITDELALLHLRRNPALISRFREYPDNWEELLSPKVSDPGFSEADVARAIVLLDNGSTKKAVIEVLKADGLSVKKANLVVAEAGKEISKRFSSDPVISGQANPTKEGTDLSEGSEVVDTEIDLK